MWKDHAHKYVFRFWLFRCRENLTKGLWDERSQKANAGVHADVVLESVIIFYSSINLRLYVSLEFFDRVTFLRKVYIICIIVDIKEASEVSLPEMIVKKKVDLEI